jgi:hypothetical protein
VSECGVSSIVRKSGRDRFGPLPTGVELLGLDLQLGLPLAPPFRLSVVVGSLGPCGASAVGCDVVFSHP